MASRLTHILSHWAAQSDECEWVLGTVYRTEGPCYRKAGAMMLFNSLGQQFGMLSGGCLESDIQRHARQVMQTQEAKTLCYDGSDEDDMSFQLGIGCGGTVYILLQPITQANDFLGLDQVIQALKERETGYFYQRIPQVNETCVQAYFSPYELPQTQSHKAEQFHEGEQLWLKTPIIPEPHLLIVGGGVDAQPLANLASAVGLGWRVSVWDSRPANARREFFMMADTLLKDPVETLTDYVQNQRVNAAVVMTHNINMDAKALAALSKTSLDYLALLGPEHRRDQVLEQAGLQLSDLPAPLAAPVGLRLGGELPESIALSVLAECHAKLYGVNAQSISQILPC